MNPLILYPMLNFASEYPTPKSLALEADWRNVDVGIFSKGKVRVIKEQLIHCILPVVLVILSDGRLQNSFGLHRGLCNPPDT